METWLSFNNNKERLRLPINPFYTIEVANLNEVVNINELGNINLIGRSDVRKVSLESFFPSKDYSFSGYQDILEPSECIKLIESWRKSTKPIRLIITGTLVNIAMAIDSFKWGENDGTGDINFTLELSEYVFTELKKADGTGADTKRPILKEKAEKYVVKEGDTLLAIAKKTTGDSANWEVIRDRNTHIDPKKLKVGEEIMIW